MSAELQAELNTEAVEANLAHHAIAQAAALVAQRTAEKNAAEAQAASIVNIANENLQEAKDALVAAQEAAATQKAEAVAKLDQFIASQPEGVPSP